MNNQVIHDKLSPTDETAPKGSQGVESRHTPTPWTIRIADGDYEGETQIITDEDNPWVICKIEPACDALNLESGAEDEANAQFIVTACNSHDELRESLAACLKIFELQQQTGAYTVPPNMNCPTLVRAREAVERAAQEQTK